MDEKKQIQKSNWGKLRGFIDFKIPLIFLVLSFGAIPLIIYYFEIGFIPDLSMPQILVFVLLVFAVGFMGLVSLNILIWCLGYALVDLCSFEKKDNLFKFEFNLTWMLFNAFFIIIAVILVFYALFIKQTKIPFLFMFVIPFALFLLANCIYFLLSHTKKIMCKIKWWFTYFKISMKLVLADFLVFFCTLIFSIPTYFYIFALNKNINVSIPVICATVTAIFIILFLLGMVLASKPIDHLSLSVVMTFIILVYSGALYFFPKQVVKLTHIGNYAKKQMFFSPKGCQVLSYAKVAHKYFNNGGCVAKNLFVLNGVGKVLLLKAPGKAAKSFSMLHKYLITSIYTSSGEAVSINGALEELRERNHLPGLVFGFVINKGSSEAYSVGYADLTKRKKISENTLFPIGEGIKTFTKIFLLNAKEFGYKVPKNRDIHNVVAKLFKDISHSSIDKKILKGSSNPIVVFNRNHGVGAKSYPKLYIFDRTGISKIRADFNPKIYYKVVKKSSGIYMSVNAMRVWYKKYFNFISADRLNNLLQKNSEALGMKRLDVKKYGQVAHVEELHSKGSAITIIYFTPAKVFMFFATNVNTNAFDFKKSIVQDMLPFLFEGMGNHQ